jgi:hypothetical protein
MKSNNKIVTVTASEQLILLVSKINATARDMAKIDACLLQITDWDAFAVLVIKRGVAGFVVKKLPLLKNKNRIPNEVFSLIEQAYLRTVNRSVLLFGHFSNVVKALHDSDIEVVALKGVYLSEHLYTEIGLRQFSDIDILIRPDKTLKAVEILQTLGFRYKEAIPVSDFIRQKSDFVHLPPMVLNGVSIELHVKLHRASEKYNVNVERVFATKIPATINGSDVFALDTLHQLIHIAVHAHKHFEEGNINFSSFMDLANLVDTIPDDFYSKSFEKLCEAYGVTEIVFRYLLLVHEFFQLDKIPVSILDKYAKCVKAKHKNKFIMYLQGYKYTEPAKTAIPGHINNLRLLSNGTDKVKYLSDLFFPPKHFMIDKYAIKNEKFYLLYYPYRYLTIFSGLWHIISKKLKTKA